MDDRSYTIVVFSDQRDGDLNNIVGSTTLEGFGEKFRRGSLYWEDHIVGLSETVMELIFSYEEKVRRSVMPPLSGEIKREHVLLVKDYKWSTYTAFIGHEDGEFKVLICCFHREPGILQVEFAPSAPLAEPQMRIEDLDDDYDNFAERAAKLCEEMRLGVTL